MINEQMKLALDKVAFLPFGKLIDRMALGRVFDGSYHAGKLQSAAWWAPEEAKYQGVAPISCTRAKQDFDPGAKYHVPGNTPYTRYFLRAHPAVPVPEARSATPPDYTGPLHECSIYGNKTAGAKFWAMLEKGSSQRWQDTLKELTGKGEMDASAILDYFAPLQRLAQAAEQGPDLRLELRTSDKMP